MAKGTTPVPPVLLVIWDVSSLPLVPCLFSGLVVSSGPQIPKVAQLTGTCLHSLDEMDSPSKFRVSTQALLNKG